MPIARITGQGLAAIALSVALLWGFFFAQHALTRRALAERTQVIREIRTMKRPARPVPASLPRVRSRLSPSNIERV